MAQLDTYELAPGVYITEAKTPPPPPSGVSKSNGAMAGVTEKGKFGELFIANTFNEWEQEFGTYISKQYPTWKHVKKFFINGGRKLYFVRIAHYTNIADKATLTAIKALSSIMDDSPTTASSIGAVVDDAGNTGDDTTATSGNYNNNVDGVFSVEVTTAGAYGGTGEVSIYFTPDSGTKTLLGLYNPIDGIEFPLGYGVNFKLSDGGDGDLLITDKWTIDCTASVYGVGNERLKVYAKTEGTYYNDITVKVLNSSLGISGEFKLEVYKAGVLVESLDNLSLDTLATNYVEKEVNNSIVGSKYISVLDTLNTNAVGIGQPDVILAGGDDGLTALSKLDYAGDMGAETGIELFAKTDNTLVIGIPDAVNTSYNDYLIKAVDNFIQNRHKNSFQIASLASDLDYKTAITHYTATLALDSDKYAMYYPFIVDADDGEQISPIGAVMGLYGRYANDINKGVWWSPAGYDAQLVGINGVEFSFTETNAGKINENRINLIKSIEGKGVTVYGARTGAISKAFDYRYIGARLNMSYIKRLLKSNSGWVPLQPNNEKLWASITILYNDILNRHYLDGGLNGSGTGDSWVVICNSDVNTEATIKQGLIIAKVGIKNVDTGEFMWVNIENISSKSVLGK